MGQAETQQRRYTAEEYLALEVKSEVRHDFYEGQLIERLGDTTTHNDIVMNCVMAFRPALRHSGNRVYMLSILLVVRENEHYTYPNVMVCGAGEGVGEIALIRRPQLLLEVARPEAEDDDRSRKFKQYQQLPSLWHYLLVSQTAWRVEWYRRNAANEWVITVLTEPDETLTIAELSLQLTVAEVYAETGVAQLRTEPLILGPETEPTALQSEE